ncbi:MAG: hypothetical protein SOZ34_08475 [Clostridia bacterium]|nr:hypothetical protein [Clostridia bacterium]
MIDIKKIRLIGISFLIILEMFISMPIPAVADDIIKLYVSVNGNDNAIGNMDMPLRTVNGARMKIRQLRGENVQKQAVVYFEDGEYYIDQRIEFDRLDKNVRYEAINEGSVKFTGAVSLDLTKAEAVTDSELLKRVRPQAARNIKKINLDELGITKEDYGELYYRGAYSLKNPMIPNISQNAQFYANGVMMNVARYPNSGFMTVEKVLDAGGKVEKGSSEDELLKGVKLSYSDTRCDFWSTAPDAKLYCELMYEWAGLSVDVKEVNTTEKSITTKQAVYAGAKPGGRFYIYNLLEELDAPGEYYIDRENNILYFYPPDDMMIKNFSVDFEDNKLSALERPEKSDAAGAVVKLYDDLNIGVSKLKGEVKITDTGFVRDNPENNHYLLIKTDGSITDSVGAKAYLEFLGGLKNDFTLEFDYTMDSNLPEDGTTAEPGKPKYWSAIHRAFDMNAVLVKNTDIVSRVFSVFASEQFAADVNKSGFTGYSTPDRLNNKFCYGSEKKEYKNNFCRIKLDVFFNEDRVPYFNIYRKYKEASEFEILAQGVNAGDKDVNGNVLTADDYNNNGIAKLTFSILNMVVNGASYLNSDYWVEAAIDNIEIYSDKNLGLFISDNQKLELGKTSSMFKFSDTENITFFGMEFQMVKNTVAGVYESSNILFENCVMHECANTAVYIASGKGNGVLNCEIYNVDNGVTISNSDVDNRRLLKSQGNFIINSRIHDFGMINRTYSFGAAVGGVGNLVAHSEFYNGAHQALSLSGINNIVEYNEFHDTNTDTADSGCIYTQGNFANRGNVIRNNYFHDIRNGDEFVVAVYQDDYSSGNKIYNNIFNNVKYGVYINGGYDQQVFENIFYDTDNAFEMASAVGGVLNNIKPPNGVYYVNSVSSITDNKLWRTVFDRLFDEDIHDEYMLCHTHANTVKNNALINSAVPNMQDWVLELNTVDNNRVYTKESACIEFSGDKIIIPEESELLKDFPNVEFLSEHPGISESIQEYVDKRYSAVYTVNNDKILDGLDAKIIDVTDEGILIYNGMGKNENAVIIEAVYDKSGILRMAESRNVILKPQSEFYAGFDMSGISEDDIIKYFVFKNFDNMNPAARPYY